MSTEITPTETATPELASTESLTDAALAEIFGTETEETADAPTDTPAEPPKEEATAVPPVETPEVPAIDVSLLDDDKAGPPKAEPPAVAPTNALHSKIAEYIPNEQVLGMVVGSHQRMTTLETALQRGDLSGVSQALGNQGMNALMESIYANEQLRNTFIDRVIEESTGQKRDPRLDHALSEIAGLKNFIQSGIQQNQNVQAQQTRQQRFASLNTNISNLFEQVRFPKDDKHAHQQQLMTDAVLARLASTNKLETALKGDIRVVRETLKPILQKFVETDRPVTQAAQQARTTIEQKPKPIATEATGTAVATEEPDIFQQAANEVIRLQKKEQRARR